LHWRY